MKNSINEDSGKQVLMGRVVYYDAIYKGNGEKAYVFVRWLVEPGTIFRGKLVSDFDWFPEDEMNSPWIMIFDDLESVQSLYQAYYGRTMC